MTDNVKPTPEQALIVATRHLSAWRELVGVFATTQSVFAAPKIYRRKVEGFLTCFQTLLGFECECFITKKGKIVTSVPGQPITPTHQRVATLADKEKDEESGVYFRQFPFTPNRQLCLISKTDISNIDDLSSTIKEHVEQLQLDRKPIPIKPVLIAIMLLGVLSLPFNMPIIGQGTAEGGKRFHITASNAGVVSIKAQSGVVNKDQVIALVESQSLFDQMHVLGTRIKELRAELEQPGNNNVNVYITKTSIDTSDAELSSLIEQINNNTLTAPQGGVLEWNEGMLGRYVNPGESLGSINQLEQTLVMVNIAAKDWRPSTDIRGFFLDYETNQKIQGVIEHTPSTIENGQGAAMYKVHFRLDSPVTLGTSGVVSFNGTKTTALSLLLKTPIRYLKSWWLLHQLN